MEPIRDRYCMARSVMTGFKKEAKTVIKPSKTSTGMDENPAPFPSEQVMTMIMMKSKTAFVARIDQSPKMPSWIAPTMAIAPMHTVREAVTKALTKSLSLAFPVFRFSHSPRRSNQPSILTASPINVPRARQTVTSMA